MPRLNVGDLKRPPRCFRPTLHSRGFETVAFSRAQDNLRVNALVSAAKWLPSHLQKRAKHLVSHLKLKLPKRKRMSLASSLDMRRYRERIIGQIYRFLCKRSLSVAFYDLVPATLVVNEGELDNVDPNLLTEQLRSDLNRCGAKAASGGLFAVLHGEYEPKAGVYVLHFHCVVWGGMIGVVERLRSRRKYKHRPDALENSEGAVYPIKATHDVEDVLYRLCYVMKSYWARSPTFRNQDGRLRRTQKTLGLKPPQLAEVLLWLDRYRIADLCLLMKIRVGIDGFEPTPKRT